MVLGGGCRVGGHLFPLVCVVAVVSVVVETADVAVVFVVAGGRFTYKITIFGLSHAGLMSEIIIFNS